MTTTTFGADLDGREVSVQARVTRRGPFALVEDLRAWDDATGREIALKLSQRGRLTHIALEQDYD